MRRQGGGFGFVVMLVVLAVIFYLAMRNFRDVAPAALEVDKHNKARRAGQDVVPDDAEPTGSSSGSSRSASADSWTPAPPSRPNLSTMDKNTSAHTSAVKDALSQSN